jgi:hypothetical protein
MALLGAFAKFMVLLGSGISRQILNNGEKASKTACGRTKWWAVIDFVITFQFHTFECFQNLSTPGSSFLGNFKIK